MKVALRKEASIIVKSQSAVNKVQHKNSTPNGNNGGKSFLTKTTRSSNNNTSNNTNNTFSGTRDNNKPTCFRCGKTHYANKCFYKNYVCSFCKQKGHLQKMCQQQQNVKQIEDDVNYVEINNIQIIDEHNPITVTVRIGQVDLQMEVDTGSALSIISENIYTKHFHNIPLKPNSTKFRGYTGENLLNKGKLSSFIKYGNKTESMDFYVIANGKTLLLGRDFLKKFKIIFSNIHAISNEFLILKDLIYKYNKVFVDASGKLKGELIRLEVTEEAQPIYLKPRTVPYALKEKLNTELDRLAKNGIISLVENNDWANPDSSSCEK